MNPTASFASAVVLHHLGLVGWPREYARVEILDRPGTAAADSVRTSLAKGTLVVALQPTPGFSGVFGVSGTFALAAPPFDLLMSDEPVAPLLRRTCRWLRERSRNLHVPRLRTLHPAAIFSDRAGEAVLRMPNGDVTWLWLPTERAGLLLVGTDLAGDLVRYRQGDPAEAARQQNREKWGIAGERPNYLFERQRSGEPAGARHVDEWAWFLGRFLAAVIGIRLDPVLPGDASGAIVLTGDDDQAELEMYREQLALIGDAPITYFLHPLTKHTRATLDAARVRRGVALGLHPDALDAPDRYEERFREQASWYRDLVGEPPRLLRNHGYLNRGYWGHLKAWLEGGVKLSSNIPGLDGSVVNGSLLPARVAYDDALTGHWSVLTAIGDGVLFIGKWSAERAAARVSDLGAEVRRSGMPGVIVLNLHPQNVRVAEPMHRAALELIRGGFVAWTLAECLEWFQTRDTAAAS